MKIEPPKEEGLVLPTKGLAVELGVADPQPATVETVVDRIEHVLRADRLDEEIFNATDRRDGCIGRRVAGEQEQPPGSLKPQQNSW